jgi:PEP-CTERM motif
VEASLKFALHSNQTIYKGFNMKQGTMYQVLSAGLIAGGLVLATPALAAGYCSAGMATEGIAVDNITFEGASSDDCYGVASGNINGNTGTSILNGMNWGTGWTYLDATDASSARFMGLDFTVSATAGTAGSWTLTGIDTNGMAPLNLPASFDFTVGMKAGEEYALWGFDNVVVDGADSGSFSIVFTNKGGAHPELSHLTVFGRESGGGSIAAIPEANTYAMLLAGLGLVGFATRRKSS